MPAVGDTGTQAGAEARPAQVTGWRRRQLCVASLWLLDGVLQVQAFMFSRGLATGRTSAHNVHICMARVLTGSTLMPAQIGGYRVSHDGGAVTVGNYGRRLSALR